MADEDLVLLRKPMKLCTYTEGTNSVLHTQKGEVVFSLTERSFHYVPPNDFLSRSHRLLARLRADADTRRAQR